VEGFAGHEKPKGARGSGLGVRDSGLEEVMIRYWRLRVCPVAHFSDRSCCFAVASPQPRVPNPQSRVPNLSLPT